MLQQMCVYLVVAYALSRTRLFIPLTRATIRWPHRIACYLIFSAFCIMGTLLGLPVVRGNAIANTPAIGAVLGGLLGGPIVGLGVGITGGLHRYTQGGSFGLAAGLDIVMQGLAGGLTHRYLIRRGKTRLLFSPTLAGGLTFITILIELGIDLALSRPFDEALQIVKLIALPELIANTGGAAIFVKILLDRRDSIDRQSRAFSAKGWTSRRTSTACCATASTTRTACAWRASSTSRPASARWPSPTARSCWPSSASATTTTCRARRSLRSRPSRRSAATRSSSPTATRCRSNARSARTASWARRW
ncbi:LytS/YhcK type 5TM receptor domain-containing protein [Rubrivivax gelatinosus]|uniref:LytS/YhcK type 5TM receptor domain-containing protein n=1 Tax=Rubrivivax gelatinosus TaxID=28068 RepID=UPI001E5C534A|nr:LytS/YhcK type 5TM receptor domain-containing protein [Rubrivivax gelatinosus]